MKRYLCKAVIVFFLVLHYSAFAGELFDPDGYYFPENDILIAGYKIESFMLHSVSSYEPNDKSVDLDHPKRVTPFATLDLTRTKDDKYFPYRFHNPTIEQNGVILSSVKTVIGDITIKGIFLDKRGRFWNLDDVTPNKKPVFEGVISIVKNGKLVYEKTHRFTYWEGD